MIGPTGAEEGDAAGDADGEPDGVAPEAVGPGVGVGVGDEPPVSAGIGSTSGPTTFGGTPPGGKAHIARTRPPPNAPANASTTDAGHQSPS